jgi:hypothetical protein
VAQAAAAVVEVKTGGVASALAPPSLPPWRLLSSTGLPLTTRKLLAGCEMTHGVGSGLRCGSGCGSTHGVGSGLRCGSGCGSTHGVGSGLLCGSG